MKFVSTRETGELKAGGSVKKEYSSQSVIMEGIAPDGGLFFPAGEVSFTPDEIKQLKNKTYAERAFFIISRYLTDYSKNDLISAAKAAYSEEKFPLSPARVNKVGDEYFLELYHGPTSAFKDVALQLMPRLLSSAIQNSRSQKDALILVATSGDTGKAALEGFAGVERTKILVFYPEDGVSEIQKKQMLTQKGGNVGVYAVKGNFDDCQTGVKAIFADPAAKRLAEERGYFLSSANSINFGRLVPQVVYYFSAISDLDLKDGELCDIVVPTGNFGNILAAYMAKRAGAPIRKLVCASNKNNVLTDFFNTGFYNKKRSFYKTSSPSMDILVSSNLERLLYLFAGPGQTLKYMSELGEKGYFSVSDEVKKDLDGCFSAYYAEESDCFAAIRETFENTGYLIDTHTAAAVFAAGEYKKSSPDGFKTLIVSTASPFKFAPAVCRALGLSCGEGFDAVDRLAEYTRAVPPAALSALRGEKNRFYKSLSAGNMYGGVAEFINA